jgi:predicted Rossmann-fold nucleotide-binding protein
VARFFAPLRDLLDAATAAGFVLPAHRNLVITESDPAALLDRLTIWTPDRTAKWLDKSER